MMDPDSSLLSYYLSIYDGGCPFFTSVGLEGFSVDRSHGV